MDALVLRLTGQSLAVIVHQVEAIRSNVASWLLTSVGLRRARASLAALPGAPRDACILVLSPGGLERLAFEGLGDGVATVGYNVDDAIAPRLPRSRSLTALRRRGDGAFDPPPGHVVVDVSHFSVNYADVTIRWGLYESAIEFVGYPICPGFDVAGVVAAVGAGVEDLAVGDRVLGITFFGGYSSRLLAPARQLKKAPRRLRAEEAAALPAVAGTALHALSLAGFWPEAPLTQNRCALVHSAAGGVGSMLVQMCKGAGCRVVAVVGATHKVAACEALGADVVVDKAAHAGADGWWAAVDAAAPTGYACVFDANGVSTLARSYRALCQTGRLIVFGFHSNLPSTTVLNPLSWLRMALDLARMPKFEPMDLTLSSKAVAGFNLSFFSSEGPLVDAYLAQIIDWVDKGQLNVPKVTTFAYEDLPKAHALIQSGRSVGKIVCATRAQ